MLRTRPLPYLYVAFCLTLILLFFHPLIFGGQTFFFRDIHRWFYPMKYFLGSALQNHQVPFWSPYYFCGAPFMSDIQSGVFYPLSALFGVLPFPAAFNLFVFVHIFLAGLFFYLFIRRTGSSDAAALVTALSYAFGGCTLSAINVLNNLTVLVWLPAVLWSFQMSRDKGLRRTFWLPVVCLACAILGGEPQLFIFIAGLLILTTLTAPVDIPITSRLKVSAAALLMILAAIGITLFQLGPTFTDYLHSVRLAGLPFEEAVENSLPVAALKHVIIPLVFPEDFSTNPEHLANFFPGAGRMTWLLSIYPGFLIAPFAVWGLIAAPFQYTRVWLVVGGLALMLALGGNTPFYKPFYKLLPVFRFPEKFIFVSNFCLITVAAPGIDTLMRRIAKWQLQPAFVAGLLAAILSTDLYISHRHLNPHSSAAAYTHYHPDLEPVLKDPALFRVFVDPRPPAGPVARQSILDHHVRWQLAMMPNLGVLLGLHQAGGKTGLELKYQYFITEILSKPWPQKLTFLKMANVKYILSRHPLDKEPGLTGLVEPVTPLVYRLRTTLPRAWLVGKVQMAPEMTLADFLKLDLDPTTAALGSADLAANHASDYFKMARSVSYTGNRVRIEVTADKPAVLVLAESAYPGWKVSVDGESRDVLWLNLFFQGVTLDKGPHVVDFEYRPQNLALFVWLSVVSVLLVVGIQVVLYKKGTENEA